MSETNKPKLKTTAAAIAALQTPARYPKPKILLVDMPDTCAAVLRKAGYNVAEGTFGRPYRVPASDALYYVQNEWWLPNCDEQEIVIVNTSVPSPTGVVRLDSPGDGVYVFWQDGTNGLIDPRPLSMRQAQPMFNNIRTLRKFHYLRFRPI